MKKQVMDLGLCAQARDEFWRSMPPVRLIPANSCWVKGAGLDLGGPQGGQDIAKYRPNRGAKRISEGPRGAKPTGQGGRAAPLAPLS